MKTHTFQIKWIFIGSILLLLTLSACVRPTPQEAESAPTVPPATAVPTQPPPPTPEISQPPEGATPEGGESPEVVTPEAPPEAQPTTPPSTGEGQAGASGPVNHVVQPGDTVYRLSVQYGVSVDAIAQANNLGPYYTIYVGQTLIIPVGGTTPPGGTPPGGGGQPGCATYHVVRPGENLFRIGLNYGYTVDQLAAANPDIINPNNIKVGQSICIP